MHTKTTILIVLFFSGLLIGGGCRRDGKPTTSGDASSSESNKVQLLRPTLAEKLVAYGVDIDSDLDVELVGEVQADGATYSIYGYSADSSSPMRYYILRGDTVIDDDELAYLVFQNFAWSDPTVSLTPAEVDSLEQLLAQYESFHSQAEIWFELAEALEPIAEGIDWMKHQPAPKPIYLEFRGTEILNIYNLWDFVCSIPLDIFDACLLEYPIEIFYTQATEVEELLTYAEHDMANVVNLANARDSGRAFDGVELSKAVSTAATSQNNLRDKLFDFESTAFKLQQSTIQLNHLLGNQEFRRRVSLIDTFMPGNAPFSFNDIFDGSQDQLTDAESSLQDFIDWSQDVDMRILEAEVILDDASFNTRNKVNTMAPNWDKPR